MNNYPTIWCQRWTLVLAGVTLVYGALPVLARYPYSAEIESVSGHWTGTQAELVWSTTVEYGTSGFRVFRQDAGDEVPLHDGFIPADITRPAGTYSVADAEQKEGAQATYRLEELRGDGSLLTLGVWTVTFLESAPESSAMLAASPPDGAAFAATPATGPAVKLAVRSNDVYSVSFTAIAAVLGLPPDEVAVRAADARLAMRCGSDPVAYLADAEGERILFHGWPASNTYTKANIFWIEPGDGRHIQRTAPDDVQVSPNLTFRSVRPFEEDLAIMTERGILRDDLYFWKSVVAGHATNGERTFDVPLDGYAGGDLTVTVHLIGWNDTTLNPDHQADIRFNGESLGSVFFDGKDEVLASFTVPEAQLLPSGNVLHIRGILQDGHITSLFVIDTFEVEYTRTYAPFGALLRADDGGHERLSADRFTAPLVLEVTDRCNPVWIADASGALPSGHSWPVAAGTAWALREWQGIPDITPQAGGFGAWMREQTNAVDYLVIAPRAFEDSARVLAAYRSGQGLRTAVALYEEICDQFADGLNSPEALQTLLAYTRQNWAAAPWMVVLGGWGHYDYLGATTPLANPLPPLLATDSATLRPTDGRFADLTGNEVPDLAIGRIPAQNIAQFNAYIDKVKAYEAGGPQASYGQAQFAADNVDAGGDFTASNLEIATQTQARYAPVFTTLDSNTVAGVRADIRAAFTNGLGMIHYTGHGSYQQLAGENLLHVNDVNAMVNPPVPFFISLTCLIGRFDMLTIRSLGETLALHAGGGTLAVYTPSGLSWNHYATSFGKEFHRVHAVERCNTIGPALMRTRQSVGDVTGSYAVAIRTYNLLGDPALKLRGGEGDPSPSWTGSFAHWRWERFSYDELADPANSLDAVGAFVSQHGFIAVSPTGRTHASDSATGQVIGVSAIVSWTAVADQSWITITEGSAGTNSGEVIYRVATNGGAARAGSVLVNGGGTSLAFRVLQEARPAPCPWPADTVVTDTRCPVFAWPAVAGATWYQLWISRNGKTHATPWVEGAATWTPPSGLPGGNYTWWVRGWGPRAGYFAWSLRMDFSMAFSVPASIGQIAPAGVQDGNSLTFLWNRDANATWYQLWVSHPRGGGWVDQWHSMSGMGEGTVTINGHPGGESSWWLRGWGPDGMGPWTGPLAFSTPDPGPAKPVLIAPSGLVGSPVTFEYESARAQWFRIYVSRGGTAVIDRWTTSATFDGGTLRGGSYSWWVGGWNGVTDRVVWSDRGEFAIP